MRRRAAKPISSRRRSASGAFSIKARRLIISSVIDGHSVRLVSQPDPTGTVGDRREAARSPACVGALAGGFAPAELHHPSGHDQEPSLRRTTWTVAPPHGSGRSTAPGREYASATIAENRPRACGHGRTPTPSGTRGWVGG